MADTRCPPFPYGDRRRVRRAAALAAIAALTGCHPSPGKQAAVDPATRITLQRSACYGSCPDYKVTIDGLGRVTFTTDTRPVDAVSAVHRGYAESVGVLLPGTHHARIDPGEVRKLMERAAAADFFALKPVYRANMTDAPTYAVTIAAGKATKTVTDYVGLQAGMPRAVQELEDAIDEAAGTKRWIEGTAEAIPALQAEKADFKGRDGAALMVAAARRNDVATMRRLQALGAPLTARNGYDPLMFAAGSKAFAAARFLIGQGAARDKESLVDATHAAISANDVSMFRLLIDAGAQRLIGPREATRMLPDAAREGNLEIAQFLLGAGANLRGPAERRQYDEPPIFSAAQGGSEEDDGPAITQRRKLVTLLLSRGADIHQCAIVCENILSSVRDPEIARMLLRAGADPKKDSNGEPLIFSTVYEGVALVLMEAGTPLDMARPGDGMTVRGWATYNKWPKVLALLKAQGR